MALRASSSPAALDGRIVHQRAEPAADAEAL
jgi:hypothetical protein